MTFRESLPTECPPADAEEIVAPKVVYRLVRNEPPGLSDFDSQRALKPNATFGVSECIARGLSVHTQLADSIRTAKLPMLKGSKPCRVTLDDGAGYLQQTGTPSHHTWWPLAEFDILATCEAVET